MRRARRQMMRVGDRHGERVGGVGAGDLAPGSSRETIAWTCAFSAPPVPTTAFLTSRGGIFADRDPGPRGDIMTTPRAWPSFRVDCGFLLTNTSSTAAPSGRCSAMQRFELVGELGQALRQRGRRVGLDLAVGDVRRGDCPRPGSAPSRSCRARDRGRGSSGELLQLLVGDVVIAPDGLDVVVLLERVDQLHQRSPRRRRGLRPRSTASTRAWRLRASPSIGSSAFATSCRLSTRSRSRGRPRPIRRPRRRPRSRLRAPCRHRPRLAGYSIRPMPLEAVADAAAGAEIAAVLGKDRADVGRGAVAVVGQRLDDQRDAGRAEALVADFLVILGVAARRLVDRALDIVLGHRLRLGGEHRRRGAARSCPDRAGPSSPRR